MFLLNLPVLRTDIVELVDKESPLEYYSTSFRLDWVQIRVSEKMRLQVDNFYLCIVQCIRPVKWMVLVPRTVTFRK